MNLQNHNVIKIKQLKEFAELFGFETRNKYSMQSVSGEPLGFAAEQGGGLFALLFRSTFGHWRKYDVHFFNAERVFQFKAVHPFRFVFQALEIYDDQNRLLGKLKQRWGILTKKFDVEDQQGQLVATMRSGLFSLWNFPIKKDGKKLALITKKWSGLLTEIFLDADNFVLEYQDPTVSADLRKILIAAALFVDLQYFERKAGN